MEDRNDPAFRRAHRIANPMGAKPLQAHTPDVGRPDAVNLRLNLPGKHRGVNFRQETIRLILTLLVIPKGRLKELRAAAF